MKVIYKINVVSLDVWVKMTNIENDFSIFLHF